MSSATVRFFAELNDFLPPREDGDELVCTFSVGTTVKDLIERLGVPHTEVDLVLVNGESVSFAYQLQEGDRVSVFPVFESLDVSGITRVRPRPLREIRFVLDVHLGKLAAYLRLLGFDALYRSDYEDATLAAISAAGKRILLTRDRGLLKRSLVDHGYCVRSPQPRAQLAEVVARFQLARLARPFSRCLHCNEPLQPAPKETLRWRVPARVLELYGEFRTCGNCDRVYWPGTHYERLAPLVEEVLGGAAPGENGSTGGGCV